MESMNWPANQNWKIAAATTEAHLHKCFEQSWGVCILNLAQRRILTEVFQKASPEVLGGVVWPFLRPRVVYNSPFWSRHQPTSTRIYTWLSRPLLPWPLTWIGFSAINMYQAAEEGEGGRDVGEVGGVEGRPSSQNSTETPLNPSKWVYVLLCLCVKDWNWHGPNSYNALVLLPYQWCSSWPRLFHSLSIGSLFSAKSRAEQVSPIMIFLQGSHHWKLKVKIMMVEGGRSTQRTSSCRRKPSLSTTNQRLEANHRCYPSTLLRS